MKNSLGDLNNFLFGQLERLDNPELTGDKLKEELHRSKAVATVAASIIENAKTILDARKVQLEYFGGKESEMPKLLEGD